MCVRLARDVESLSKKIEEQHFFLLHTPDHSQPTICLVDLVDSFLRWLSAPAPRSGKSLCPADVTCGTWNIWGLRVPPGQDIFMWRGHLVIQTWSLCIDSYDYLVANYPRIV